MKQYLLLLFGLLVSVCASSQTYLLSGKITDPKNTPIPFASVYIRNSTYGTSANENGFYQLKLNKGNYDVIFRFVGYRERVEHISITSDTHRDIKMGDDSAEVQRGAIQHNVTDSAAGIIRKVLDKRQFFLHEVQAFTCQVYIKGVQRLDGAPKSLMGHDVAHAMGLDTNGKGMLYQSESLSNFSYEQPGKVKENVIASKFVGQNTAFSYNKASDLSVNFYNDYFYIPGLASRGFISPLADKAMFYYKYRLLGAKVENGVLVYKIEVIPKRFKEESFRGYIYIIDGEWRIYSADLTLTKKNNNLNLVDTLEVSQQYVPIKNSTWLPLSTQFTFRGNVLGFKFNGYYLSLYNNYNLTPNFPPKHFNGEILKIDTVAANKDSAYWKRARPIPLTYTEGNYYHRKDSAAVVHQKDFYLDSLQHVKNNFIPIPYLPFGYHASSKDNKDSLYVYPFVQTVYYNTVEGFGLNLKARLSRNYSDMEQIAVTPDLRYGFHNNTLSANVHLEYLYDPFKMGKFFGGFGSDVLDLNDQGTRSLYFNTLSTVLSGENYVKYYRSQFGEFGYRRMLTHAIIWTAKLNYAQRTQMYNGSYFSFGTKEKFTSNNPLMPDAPADDRSELFPQNQAMTFSTSLDITPGQQYITRPTGIVLLPSKYPTLTVNYRKGINGIFGSDVNYDFASVQLSQDHIPIRLLGFSSFRITAGNFFNRDKLYFMDYQHFIGNQGTTFDPDIGSFHFLPFYTFSTDGGFLEAHYEHNFAGSLFSNIPFLRSLKLDEIIGGNFLTEKTNRNYSEVYIGVQRFIFRIDYGISFEGNNKYIQGFRFFYGIK